MPKYFLDRPAFIDNRYIDASPQNPQVVEFPKELAPSRQWKPVDKAAQAALLKLGVKAELYDPAAEPKVEEDETKTMADLNARLTDRSPV